jgi:folate-binding protein YgfZ
MSTSSLSRPFALERGAVSAEEVDAVFDSAVVSEVDASPVDVTGPGALVCFQGLLTNDLETAGEGAVVYGAVLTPKGLIVCDMFVTRTDGHLWLSVPTNGAAALRDVTTKYLPPRLARSQDRSDDLTILRLTGPRAVSLARRAGLGVPEYGRSVTAIANGIDCLLSRPQEDAFFDLQIQTSRNHTAQLKEQLRSAGVLVGSPSAIELARIIWGWPKLGAEIDDKTLPQEVRFDDLNGVSYTKGCYTGQETVARVHFRGHPNRQLRGLIWDDDPNFNDASVSQDGKLVGRVTSAAWLPPLEQYVGLAVIHRKANLDRPLIAADAAAAATSLPFDFDSFG